MPGRRAPGLANPRNAGGFTLVEVLVALIIVVMGLSALMVSVSGTARTSGYLRDKTLAQWIALNRLTEVRLSASNKFAQNTDTGELIFAGRPWHYDTRYFDTTFATMKRVVVRVYAGDAKTKGNPIAESTSFVSTALGNPGSSNSYWVALATPAPTPGVATVGATPTTTTPGTAPGTVASPQIGTTAAPTPSAPPQSSAPSPE